MKKVIFDSSALIPASKYVLQGRAIGEHLAEYVEIHIPTAVQNETVGQPEKFANENVLQKLIAQNKIIIDSIQPADLTAEMLVSYNLGAGEQEAILLYLQNQDKFAGVIVDDYVAAIVCRRLQIGNMLLLDLIVQLEREQIMPHALAVAMIVKIAPRYNRGFVEHSLQMLGEPKVVMEPPPTFIKEEFERFLAGKFPSAPEADWRQRFGRAYGDYFSGRISLARMSQQLHISIAALDRLLDEIKLPVSTNASELVELWEPHRASMHWLNQIKSNRNYH